MSRSILADRSRRWRSDRFKSVPIDFTPQSHSSHSSPPASPRVEKQSKRSPRVSRKTSSPQQNRPKILIRREERGCTRDPNSRSERKSPLVPCSTADHPKLGASSAARVTFIYHLSAFTAAEGSAIGLSVRRPTARLKGRHKLRYSAFRMRKECVGAICTANSKVTIQKRERRA